MKYLGANVESYRICEWAVKSIQAYKDLHFAHDTTDYSQTLTIDEVIDFLANKGISANYNTPMTREQVKRMRESKCRQVYNNIKATRNLVNIMQVKASDLEIVEKDKYCYVMTYSFPCQDLSKAGLGKGMAKDSGTRSGLLWEVERLLDECNGNLPQVLLMENVPDVIGSKNIKHFAKWLEKLESLGYKCYWKVLNGKDYGIPQNRERCFMVSILGDYFYAFPQSIKLEKRLKDLLETEVDEKYYLSDVALKGLQNTSFNCSKLEARTQKNGVMATFRARDYKEPKLVVEQSSRCIQAGMLSGGNLQPKIAEPLTTRGSNIAGAIRATLYKQGTRNLIENLTNGLGYEGVIEPIAYDEQNKYLRKDGCVGTLTTDGSSPKHNNRVVEPAPNNPYELSDAIICRIRKLTPKECWRLMGVKDSDFEKVAPSQSNSSLYHLAGDSIITTVLMAIFSVMLDVDWRDAYGLHT